VSVNARKKKADQEVNCKIDKSSRARAAWSSTHSKMRSHGLPTRRSLRWKLVPFEGQFQPGERKGAGLKKGTYTEDR